MLRSFPFIPFTYLTLCNYSDCKGILFNFAKKERKKAYLEATTKVGARKFTSFTVAVYDLTEMTYCSLRSRRIQTIIFKFSLLPRISKNLLSQLNGFLIFTTTLETINFQCRKKNNKSEILSNFFSGHFGKIFCMWVGKISFP